MNQDIYNKKVATFELKIKEIEQNILNDSIQMETIMDFNHFFRDMENILQEYQNLYDDMNSEASKNQLIDYLTQENDFLMLIIPLLNRLEHYHHTIGFVSNQEIASEWKDIKAIIQHAHTKQQINQQLEEFWQKGFHASSNSEDMILEPFFDLKDKLDALEQEDAVNRNRIEELGNATERIFVNLDNSLEQKNKIQEVQKNIQQKAQQLEALYAIDHFMQKENIEDFEETVLRNTKELELDEDYLESLPLPDKIAYLKMLLTNIEKASGKKSTVKYKGIKKRISSKYLGKWVKCQTLLNQYQNRKEEVVAELTEDQQEINEQIKKQEYAKLYGNFKTVEASLLQLSQKSENFVNTKQVIAVASLNKEPLYILKEDLERFNKVFMNYKRYQKDLNDFAIQNNMDILDTDQKFETLDDLQNQYLKKLSVLQNAPATFEVQEEIRDLKKKLYKLNKGKKFAIFANIKMLLKSFNFSENMQQFLEEVIEEPEKFTKSTEYSEEKKKKILEDVLSKIDDYKQNSTNKISHFLNNQIDKVKKCFNKIPKNAQKVFKIKSIKESKNKKALIGAIGAAAALSMIALGSKYFRDSSVIPSMKDKMNIESMEDLAMKSITDTVKTNDSGNKITISNLQELFQEEANTSIVDKINTDKVVEKYALEENKEEPEKKVLSETEAEDKNHDFGDTFVAGDTVYTNQEDMAREENGVSTYFDSLSKRKVAGIVYDYNGNKITIFDTDSDAEDKKTALENNGAKQIGYVGRNELANSNGYEGFFSDKDKNVHFILSSEEEAANETNEYLGFFADEDASFLNSIDEELARGGR